MTKLSISVCSAFAMFMELLPCSYTYYSPKIIRKLSQNKLEKLNRTGSQKIREQHNFLNRNFYKDIQFYQQKQDYRHLANSQAVHHSEKFHIYWSPWGSILKKPSDKSPTAVSDFINFNKIITYASQLWIVNCNEYFSQKCLLQIALIQNV